MSGKQPLKWETIRVRLGDLVPNPENPKFSTEGTTSRLNDSIDTLGEFQPFVVDHDGVSAVDGHQRLGAWIAHKGEEFEVEAKRPSRKLTKTERHKLILYSGKGTHGTFDFDLLSEHFEMSEAIDFGGFDAVDLALAYNESNPEPYEPPSTREVDPDDLSTDHTCPKCGFEF